MRAALLEAYDAPMPVREVDDPHVPEHGVVVRVLACGICRSDWHAWKGHWADFFKLPHVLGHEMCGVIEEVGKGVKRFSKGERVLIPFCGGEGTCPQCRAGHSNICDFPFTPGFSHWGGFAEYVAIQYADFNLEVLPDSIDTIAAAGMGCRFITAFHALVTRAGLNAGEWVAIYGCGGVGLSAVQIAAAAGAHPVCIDINDEALALAETLGARATINAKNTADAPEAVHDITGGGAHIALDALGHEQTCRNALLSLRKRGRHVQVGMSDGVDDIALPIDSIIGKELSLVGSKGMPANNLDTLLRLVSDGRLDPMRLVSKTVSLEETGNVLNDMSGFNTQGFVVIDRF
ncbi:MAG: zinc-dependent alcohol dehydrogenase family protein [Hyphomicrobiales bacterium]|nr:zinc-dependent alcohol dehydrogenase family protein [Hyphomicrobiales bacterium]